VVRYKYSPEVLAKAAAEAHSIAEVNSRSSAFRGVRSPESLLILKAAGLTTAAARHSRLSESAGVA
jgi:hypothetical protein